MAKKRPSPHATRSRPLHLPRRPPCHASQALPAVWRRPAAGDGPARAPAARARGGARPRGRRQRPRLGGGRAPHVCAGARLSADHAVGGGGRGSAARLWAAIPSSELAVTAVQEVRAFQCARVRTIWWIELQRGRLVFGYRTACGRLACCVCVHDPSKSLKRTALSSARVCGLASAPCRPPMDCSKHESIRALCCTVHFETDWSITQLRVVVG